MLHGFNDPSQDHTDAVPHDRFDRAMWDEAREDSRLLDRLMLDWRRRYDYAEDFSLDIFNLLVKGAPELRSPQDMRGTHVPNRQLAQDIASLPELQSLRQYTIADGFVSAVSLLGMKDKIEEALDRTKALQEQAQAAQEAREQWAQAQQDAQDNPSEGAQAAADAAREAAEQALDDLQAQAEATSAGVRSEMREGLKGAAKEAQESAETAYMYGIGPGDLQRLNFEDRMRIAQTLSGSKLREFAKLIGAFRQLASVEYRRRVVDGADETLGVEFGDDLTRLTTQELLNLASKELEDDFWLRYSERGLLVKKLHGRERMGRGPIVYVGDESSSMGGLPEMWMKGLALALLDQAVRQKRDFHYIGFSGKDKIREFSFRSGRSNRLDVLAMAEGFLNGGTHFEKPLRRALDLISESGEHRPDVVFATDGEAPIPTFLDEWTATRERLSVRAYGVYISAHGGAMPAALTKTVDNVRTIRDLTDVSQVRDILRPS